MDLVARWLWSVDFSLRWKGAIQASLIWHHRISTPNPETSALCSGRGVRERPLGRPPRRHGLPCRHLYPARFHHLRNPAEMPTSAPRENTVTVSAIF